MNRYELENIINDGVIYPAEYTDLVGIPTIAPERFSVHYGGRTFFVEVSEVRDEG